ncbi:MAG: hypothetical protein ACQEXG_14880 [Pseudomonadota bacterium]
MEQIPMHPPFADGVSYAEDHPDVLPRTYFFPCERRRAHLSQAACLAQYRETGSERHSPCRGCPIGTCHAGDEPLPPVIPASKTCVRCGTAASRLIGKSLCPSCYNREREWRNDANARGRRPAQYQVLHPRQLGVVLPGGETQWWAFTVQNALEPIARALRSRPGVRLHDQRPGDTEWHEPAGGFVYVDGSGRALVAERVPTPDLPASAEHGPWVLVYRPV